MIRKILVVAAAMAMPVGIVAAGGVAGAAKTVVPPDPSQTLTISASVNFSLGLSAFGTATTDKTSTTTVSDETLSGHDGNAHASTATIDSLVNVASKTTKCATTVTPSALAGESQVHSGFGPVTFSSANDPSAAADVASQESHDATNLSVPAACVTAKVKVKKDVSTYTLSAAKENVAGSLGGFASTGASSLAKALKSLQVTVNDTALTGGSVAYAIKTTSVSEVIGGCGGSGSSTSLGEVGFLASGTVSSPKVDKGQAAALTACLGTVTSGTGGATGQQFLDVLLSGIPAEVINTVAIDPTYSSFTIGS